jgi:peroxiredoxin
MSNGLTGEYDAIVEVKVQAVNRVIATLHQNGLWNDPSPDATPRLLHRLTGRVGQTPKLPRYELASAFLEGLGADSDDISRGSPEMVSVLEGLSRSLQDVFQEIESASSVLTVELPAWLVVVRGVVKVQLSAPSIAFPSGSTSEVSVRCQLRALYFPDPGTAVLPEPIHGELRATFTVDVSPSVNDGTLLEVTPPTDDSKVQFLPAPGASLTAAETKQIERQIGLFLRKKFEPINHELPGDFKFKQFKALGSGSTQAVALPLMLSTPHIPALGLDSVANKFLDPSDDFGFAISKEHVNSLLAPFVNQIKAFKHTYTATVTYPVPWPPFVQSSDVSYHVAISNVTTSWELGKVTLTASGSATTSSVLPNYTFTITRSVTVTLNAATQVFSLHPVGSPGVAGSLPGFAKGIVKQKVQELEGPALAQAQGNIQAALSIDTLADALHEFDASTKARYTAIEIEPDGLIVRGALLPHVRQPVVVDFEETLDGTGFTAYKSWIPAGTIEKYVWSWISAGQSVFAWLDGVHHEHTEVHRFTMPMPGRGSKPVNSQVCLRVDGTQVDTGGISGANDSCQVDTPGWMTATMPSYWDWPLMLPVWGPDPAPDGRLDSGIVAHVNVASGAHRQSDASLNSIVHFTESPSVAVALHLQEAALRTTHENAAVAMILVMPPNALKEMAVPVLGGSEPAGNGRAAARRDPPPFALTEDYEGGWSRAFGVREKPATYLMNAAGQIVWQHVGTLTPAMLTTALDEHLIPGRRPRARLQRLAVRAGAPALDFLFELGDGRRMALRRLRGQQVLLNFWRAWSTPCLAELRHLQRAFDASGHKRVILAIADGADAGQVAQVRQELGLTFKLIPDPDRSIARRYRVDCWPTTVSIGSSGIVDRIHFGATPDEHRVTREHS